MTTSLAPDRPAQGIPARYWVWLGGAGLSLLGTQVLGFAMAWVAAGYSATLAGAVLAATNLPRALLLLIGGAMADRHGPWRVMISGDAVMTIMTAGFAAAVWILGPGPWLLIVAALLIGVVDAFYLPASGSMPRRLVPAHSLARAMSARQLAGRATAVLGGPLGAAVISIAGLAIAAVADSATFVVMLTVLVLISPRRSNQTGAPQHGERPAGRPRIPPGDGIAICATTPLLRAALFMLAGTSAFLLPVVVPLVPVLAHQRGWAPSTAGYITAAEGIAVAAVALLVVLTGGFARPGLAGCSGIAAAAVGVLGLVLLHGSTIFPVAAGALIGAGTGMFSTHVGPLVLGNTPPTHLARVQAVVALAQSLPLLASNLALGALAQAAGATTALVLCAVMLLAVSVLAALSPQLRAAHRI